MKVGIINLECNNLFSIYYALKVCGYNVIILNDNHSYNNFDFLVLPGVGAYNSAMKIIKKKNIDKKINDYLAIDKKNFIYGICLGMQLLFTKSNENNLITKGLNLISGNVVSLDKKKFIVPNIGWRDVFFKHQKRSFYHIHSYYCKPSSEKKIFSYTKMNRTFKYCSAIIDKQILGTQFHPEKSGKQGLDFLKKIPKIMKNI